MTRCVATNQKRFEANQTKEETHLKGLSESQTLLFYRVSNRGQTITAGPCFRYPGGANQSEAKSMNEERRSEA
jgi:hypothetical protein